MSEYKISIIGLGYVGLPLAVEFGKKYKTVGYDINEKRIDELKKSKDRTLEVSVEEMEEAENLSFTKDLKDISQCNIHIITVPTPIDQNNNPDLTYIEASTRAVASYIKKDDIVVYESTVYPGVTENICVPLLEEGSGLKFNEDFFCAYSPERINPGDKDRKLPNIVKITSGSTPETAEKIDKLYKSIITAGTFLADSIQVAEAAKVIENIQRDVNIALVNELAMIFNRMNIDTNKVLDAASTKWNFVPMRPGLVGGHCIGVDPYYLLSKAQSIGYTPDLIRIARQINNGMGEYIAEKSVKEMISRGIKVAGANILMFGATFKENCPDTRNTKVVDIIKSLESYSCSVDVYDPWIDSDEERKNFPYKMIKDNPFEQDKKYDAFIFAVSHKQFKELSKEDLNGLSNSEESIIIDVKSTIENPTWRL